LLALVSRAAKQQDCVQCTNPPPSECGPGDYAPTLGRAL
jgi:hypothetical protein